MDEQAIINRINEQMSGMGMPATEFYYTVHLRFGDLVISVSMPRSEVVTQGIDGVEDVVMSKLANWIIGVIGNEATPASDQGAP